VLAYCRGGSKVILSQPRISSIDITVQNVSDITTHQLVPIRRRGMLTKKDFVLGTINVVVVAGDVWILLKWEVRILDS